jgi:hypothetical protein
MPIRNKIELRRFRCYETAMVTAYTRPFSQSKGMVPKLSLEMTGVQLGAERGRRGRISRERWRGTG